MANKLLKYCNTLYDSLTDEARKFSPRWKEFERFYRPVNSIDGKVNETSNGVYTAEASYCWGMLANGLYSYMIPDKSYFFSLKYGLEDNTQLRRLESENSKKIHFYLEQTNFREEVYKAIRDCSGYGTSSMFMEFKREKGLSRFIFKTFPIDSIFPLRDYKTGELTTVIRKFELSPDDAANLFGVDSLAAQVKNKVGLPAYINTKSEYLHIVTSDEIATYADIDGFKLHPMHKFKSIYIDKSHNHIVSSDGGFETMPYIVPMYLQLDYSQYGTSDALEFLAETRMFNTILRICMYNLEMISNPPLLDPMGSFENKQVRPGAILTTLPNSDKPEFLKVDANPNAILELISYQRQVLRQMMKVDLFQRLSDKKYLTAYQASEIAGEGLDMLSPIVNNLQQMLLRPIIEKAHHYLVKSELIEKPNIDEMTIEYLGKLAFAVKSLENRSAVELVNAAGMVAQFNPEAIDVINWDKLIKDFSYNTGAPTSWILNDNKITEKRNARAQQEAIARTSEDAKNIGSAVANLGKGIDPNSILGGLM